MFGLITSDHTSSFGGLIDVKEELTDLDDAVMIQSLDFEQDATTDLTLQASHPILEELQIDLQLLDQPASTNMATTSTKATKRKLESALPIDGAGGVTLTTAARPLETSESAIEDAHVEANPIEAMPPIAKRARLGSLTEPLDSDADAQALPHAASKFDTSRPGHLDYYFKTANVSAVSVNTPESKLTRMSSTCSASFPSHHTTSTANKSIPPKRQRLSCR